MNGRDVARQQRIERAEQAYRAGNLFPVPRRITMALDLRGLDGPEVDVACLAREPDVDLWEAGAAAPSFDQLQALATLTGFAWWWFVPLAGEPPKLDRDLGGWLCTRGRGGGCTHVEPHDWPEPYSKHSATVIPLHRQRQRQLW